MTTAFVLSGGASIAAVQVGMMQALAEREIRPDLLVGTSAGAINAAYVAGSGAGTEAMDGLAQIWIGLRRRDVFPLDPSRALLALIGARSSLCSPDRLAELLQDHLPYRRLEDARIPVHLLTADLLTGQAVLLSTGDTLCALLASSAIPAVFPMVERDGRFLCDGALADSAGVSQAVALGADRIYVLPGGTACALDHPPRTPVTSALHALTLLLQQRLLSDTSRLAGDCELHVLPPLCPVRVSPADFGHAVALISLAKRAAGRWLDADRVVPPERLLSLHSHRRTGPDGVTAPADDAQPAVPLPPAGAARATAIRAHAPRAPRPARRSAALGQQGCSPSAP
jgi:NTE family protein